MKNNKNKKNIRAEGVFGDVYKGIKNTIHSLDKKLS